MKSKPNFKYLLALVIMFVAFINFKVSATTHPDLNLYRTLGRNTIIHMTKIGGNQWNDVEIVNSRILYNFADNLIGCSIDLKNKGTNEKAYVILNSNIDYELISEFSIGTHSPYTEKKY